MSLKAIVKSAISGDSLVLRGRPGPQGQPPKERVLHLADLQAPRLGTSTREDEPWAFEAREFLRALAVGKEVSFTTIHSLPSNDDVPRDLGSAEIGGADLSSELLRNGWAKLKEIKREPSEEDLKKRELENEAKAAGRGIWNPHGQTARAVHHTMPLDSQGFVSEWKGIVEQVRDGTTLRIRLLLPDGDHQIVNIALAGVKSARAASKPGEASEPWSEEAKFFTESRLLQRPVRVQILSLPNAAPTPFQSTANAAPASASIFIGTVANGLARVVDWHAGMLSASGGMERLRSAEKAAKEKRVCLYANLPASSANASKTVAVANGQSREFDGTVVRAAYANEAREFLRKRLIGKHVKVHIDFVRPREGEFEERECATIRYGNQGSNVAEQLIERGLAGVVRHKRDDEDRSPDYDKLIAAEQSAATEQKGVHSGKEVPPPKQPLNLSENANRAAQFLNGFKRQGRIPAVVEYVAAGSRFKILLPKDNQTLTLVLGGIRAPRAPRNPSDKAEPYGAESLEFSTHRYMQRDVEVEIETTDKSGGFIGALYLNKNENAAVALAKEGLASVHAYSAEALPWSRQLFDAEIWADYDEEAEKAAAPSDEKDDNGALKAEYLDIIISDVRTNNFGFSVQILNTEGIASLEKLMRDFSLHHKSPTASPPGFVPKNGELVSAKFSDGAWYRAKIRRSSPIKKEAEVTFIDYGNQDTVSFSNIRPLDQKFRSLPGQAHDARLSFVKLPKPDSEYYPEAIDRFRSLCEGRKLVANIDHREGPLLHLRLIDPTDASAAQDPFACINADLVAEGLASTDRKGCRYIQAYPQVVQKLRSAVAVAKRDRAGIFEFGDVEESDNE
ncbi:hypothetical protein MD484_g7282, partial [Candolleomyces efflorescens]